MSESQRITIQSHLEVAVWVKYVLPVMLLGGTLLIFGKNALTWRFFFVVPSILLAFFFFSLAVIRVSDGTVWYKQFFEWTAIDTNEVVDSGQVWAGVIGYIRLKRFVRPWGKLYIVLDESSSSNPFRKGEHALLHYLGNGLRQHENEGQNPESVGRFSSNYGLLLGASTGVLFYLLGRSLPDYSFSRSVFDRSLNSKEPLGIVLLKILHLLETLQATSLLFAIFAFVAVYRRHRPKSWTFAFLAGVLLPHVLFLWLTR